MDNIQKRIIIIKFEYNRLYRNIEILFEVLQSESIIVIQRPVKTPGQNREQNV